jgi:hypothetical protein
MDLLSVNCRCTHGQTTSTKDMVVWYWTCKCEAGVICREDRLPLGQDRICMKDLLVAV